MNDVTSCLAAWSHVPLGVCDWCHVASRGGGISIRRGVSVRRRVSAKRVVSVRRVSP